MIRKRFLSHLTAVLLLSLVGCAEPEDADRNDSVATPPPSPVTEPSEALDDSVSERIFLALTGEGLQAVRESGSTSLLPFGIERNRIEVAATNAFGESPSSSGSNEDCGVDFLSWDDRITIYLEDGLFVGWFVGDPGLTSLAGIGVGSSRREVEEVLEITTFESTLGSEFMAGDLVGIFSDDGPDSTVDALWSGRVCNAR